MPFRASDFAEQNYQRACSYLLGALPTEMRETSRLELERLVDELGPVVDSYPTWHPLVHHQENRESPTRYPDEDSGYRGLDHTVYLRDGFISCPYGKGEELIKSVDQLQSELRNHPVASIDYEVLTHKLYHEHATAILVRCHWNFHMNNDRTVPLPKAIGLLLDTEIPCWHWSKYGETWETMREYFLGTPCGKRSSLFVNEKTGLAMKKVWNTIINTGLFGPLKVGN